MLNFIIGTLGIFDCIRRRSLLLLLRSLMGLNFGKCFILNGKVKLRVFIRIKKKKKTREREREREKGEGVGIESLKCEFVWKCNV